MPEEDSTGKVQDANMQANPTRWIIWRKKAQRIGNQKLSDTIVGNDDKKSFVECKHFYFCSPPSRKAVK